LFFITVTLVCSWGDFKLVLLETSEFLSASAAFLAINKGKGIQPSTIKNKLGEWMHTVDAQRSGWVGGGQTYEECAIHAPWIYLILQIQQAKKKSKVKLKCSFYHLLFDA
jgi:hypothetical protein